ncbi:CDP-alcohol phosphatidyltransferase family protein [Psychromonas sp. Urea-02u-13]|uniref:CDP-alcohol phosphatidyltransferase family protein n=1 Tax=Psychromonas sp. Urea-02u-13 TaxID=2058326 RepID=UPI000C32DC6D|nr:CDP-alcohol phosphatidyltransferase family protein [Psychromonas sp. Urea-02u-13]PKG39066.1 hypothetical protein CXF74_10205 [Psychromonas sp. Urea-02u-13]
MLTIYDLKPKFQNLLRPIVAKLARANITPNQVTLSAMILSLCCGVFIYFSHSLTWTLLVLPIILLLRMALNAIDGMLAREYNQQTKKGAMLNEMTDVMADVVMYLPLAYVAGVSASFLVAFVIIGVFTEMAGVVAQTLTKTRRYDGPMGKSDRAFVISFLAILLSFNLINTLWISIYLGIVSLLGLFTLFRRMDRGCQ